MLKRIVYSLPPLDDVWIYELEQHDQRKKLQAQCFHHQEHQFIYAHNVEPPHTSYVAISTLANLSSLENPNRFHMNQLE